MAYDLSLSTRYLSDLLKHEAGKTTMELIHIFLISEAKNHLRLKEKTVSEIAYELGFENASFTFINSYHDETVLSRVFFDVN